MRLSSSRIKRLLAKKWRFTIPTYLTISRIFLTPFIIGAMVTHHWGVAFWLFIIAAVTDVLDGVFARLLNQKTFLGACLDPLADKLLIISCFFTLAFVQSPLFHIPIWFVSFVLLKEILQVMGAGILFSVRACLYVRPSILGKAAMAAQTTFIIWLFACYFFHWLPIRTYVFMLGIVVVLVSLSFIQYVLMGYKQLVGQYEPYS